MTREQAIAAARDYVKLKGRSVCLEAESVRLMEAARFNDLFGQEMYPCDFWVVEFVKILPPGVAAESPGSIIVEVIPTTGEVREVYVGMWVDLMASRAAGIRAERSLAENLTQSQERPTEVLVEEIRLDELLKRSSTESSGNGTS